MRSGPRLSLARTSRAAGPQGLGQEVHPYLAGAMSGVMSIGGPVQACLTTAKGKEVLAELPGDRKGRPCVEAQAAPSLRAPGDSQE